MTRSLYPFLAPNDPSSGGVLVVEGWTTDYTFKAAATQFASGGYSQIFVVGGQIEHGLLLGDYETFAERGAAVLRAFGVPGDKVIAVPAPSVRQDRTYTSFRALSRWWEVHGGAVDQIHLVAEGAHARRSRLLAKMALKGSSRIGVTSVPPQSYDERRWWQSSAGFRSVTSELLAYTYARVFFRP